MAKVTPGPLAGQISGKIGNVVFSRGRYGSYMRVRSIPTLVQNEYTNAVRGRLSALSQAWAALDAGERIAWSTWAATNPITDRLGVQQVLQPSAAFIQLNARIIQAGGIQIDVPPISVSPAPVSGLTVTIDTGAGDAYDVGWTSGALGATECLAIWCAVVDGVGRSYYKNLKKLLQIGAGSDTTPADIETSLTARFGDPLLGQKVYIECEVWDKSTGLISGKAIANTVVVTT
jgi:hypothetical protein